MTTKESSTETLIEALRVLSSDIKSEDGVANAAIAEAAERLERYHKALKRISEYIPAKNSWRVANAALGIRTGD